MSQKRSHRTRRGAKSRPRNRRLLVERMEDRRMLAQTVGLFTNEPESFEGYTLFAPSTSTNTYLIDQAGELVNEWQSSYTPMPSYLIGSDLVATDETGVYDEGDMIRSGRTPDPAKAMAAPGASGIVELYSWGGDLKWQFEINENDDVTDGGDSDGNRDLRIHHDIEVMPNGNIVMIAWERVKYQEAVDNGRDPATLQESDRYELWPDAVIEVDPSINNEVDGVLVSDRSAIVWQWSLFDHVVQNKYPNLPNYGTIAGNPHRIDLNYIPEGDGAGGQLADWTHFNGIDYNEHLDQIVVSSREYSEFWVIDHSTTTEEAATNQGGRSGMGGRILYRWGSPETYNRGTLADQQMRYQHDPTWIDRDIDPGQNFLIFDNGWNRRGEESWSQVHEIDSPDDQQFILNNRTDGSTTNLVIFGTRALNYTEDFPALDSPWSASWIPVMGNWDNKGSDSGGFYDPENNVFIVTNKKGPAKAWTDLVAFDGPDGAGADWLPIAGDWDNNGTDDAGLYDPALHMFHQRAANGDWHSFEGANVGAHWLPIAGDWDGVGPDTVGLYNPNNGNWRFSNGVGEWQASKFLKAPAPVGKAWLPIAGDWNGNGKDTVGLYNPNDGNWYLNNRINGSITDLIVMPAPVDVPGKWQPIVGDWNNNGEDSVGLYDPSYYSILPGQPFAPYSAEWTYAAPRRSDFFATIISGAQRLPNGNTLINEGTEGRFFEVTPQKEIVWEYKNPQSLQSDGPPGTLDFDENIPAANFGIPGVDGNLVFRAYRYGPDYTPQFAGGDLEGDDPIEVYPDYYDTPGLYDPATNDWYLNNHSDGTITDLIIFNTDNNDPANWVPVSGDWDGDGFDSAGIYSPNYNQFYLNNPVDGSDADFVTIQVPVTYDGWTPIIGDWDGDGIDEVGMYDPDSNEWILNYGNEDWSSAKEVPAPGPVPASWLPITGDWDGNGEDTVGLYDPSTNNWYLNNQTNGEWSLANNPATGKPFGVIIVAPVLVPASWIPVTGDWNGNGKDTVGLYDPSTGDWFLNNKINGKIDDLLIVEGRGEPSTWRPITGDWDGTGAVVPAAAAALLLAESEGPNLPPARNPFNPVDANGDGVPTALDVLSVVDAINTQGTGPLTAPLTGVGGHALYGDVNGDWMLTAEDILHMVHSLNTQARLPISTDNVESFVAAVAPEEMPTFNPFLVEAMVAAARSVPVIEEVPTVNNAVDQIKVAAIAAIASPEEILLDEILDDLIDDVASGWLS